MNHLIFKRHRDFGQKEGHASDFGPDSSPNSGPLWRDFPPTKYMPNHDCVLGGLPLKATVHKHLAPPFCGGAVHSERFQCQLQDRESTRQFISFARIPTMIFAPVCVIGSKESWKVRTAIS